MLYPDDGYIYLIFSKKDKKFPDLNHLLEMQKDEVLRHYRESKIEYIKSVSRDDCKTKMRVIERAEVKDLIEYTLFLDFPEVIISLTLISPKTKSNNYLKKLEWTGEKLKKGYVIFNSDSSPSVKI